MGFLAFLLIGGASGAFAWILCPKASKGSKSTNAKGFIAACLLGFISAAASAFLGQYLGLFQSGQILEWLSAIVLATVVACTYTVLAK